MISVKNLTSLHLFIVVQLNLIIFGERPLPDWMTFDDASKNDRPTVTDCRNRVCDCRKASLNGRHDWQYLDVTTTFTNFNSFTKFSQTIFAIFSKSKTIYDVNIVLAISNIEMVSNSLKS